jgi:Flp pilus assembly pilin Flp
MLRFLWLFLNIKPSQRAQAMTEYILIIGLVAVAIIAVLLVFSKQLHGIFKYVVDKLAGRTATWPGEEAPEWENPMNNGSGG